MKKSEIEKVKRSGAKQGLIGKLSGVLWEIKFATDRAGKDSFKDLPKEIAKIRKLADDADDLWKEVFNA